MWDIELMKCGVQSQQCCNYAKQMREESVPLWWEANTGWEAEGHSCENFTTAHGEDICNTELKAGVSRCSCLLSHVSWSPRKSQAVTKPKDN